MPVVDDILICGKCDNKHTKINLTNCVICGSDLGAPNVNELALSTEIKSLDERYGYAKSIIGNKGRIQILNNFEKYFLDNAKGVINMSLDVLNRWICKDLGYQNYYRLTEENGITIKKPDDDRKRSVIDAFLFGSRAKDFYFAAISLTNSGLQSYGNYTVILNELLLNNRASVLEENSYRFVERHEINYEDFKIPLGYRSDWKNKLKLTVSKLHEQIDKDNNKYFCDIVLKNTGNKFEDDFLEIHIYKEISPEAIKHICIPDKKRKSKYNFVIKKIEEQLPGKIIVIT